MRDRATRLRAGWLAAMVLLSVVAGTVALSGATAAATAVSIGADDPTADAATEYTAEANVELSSDDSLQHVGVRLGPADVSDVGEDDITVVVNDETRADSADDITDFSASDGVVEFKLKDSVDGISDGERVEIRVGSVTNPGDDFRATAVLNDTADEQWQEFSDSVAIDSEPDVTYSGLDFDDGTEPGTDTTVSVGDDLDVSATVENTGDQAGTYNASLTVDGEVRQWNNGTIAGNSETTTTFGTSFSETGTYDVAVADAGPTEVTVAEPVEIVDGAASPSDPDPGATVDNQKIYVDVADVSADGDSDRHYVAFPDALAEGLSVNFATVNGSASVDQSAELVDGYDGDGTRDTVTFSTDGDDGEAFDLKLTVDVSVDYPDTEGVYEVDARTEDSRDETVTQSDVVTVSTAERPTVSDYAVSNPAGRDAAVSFDASEQLETIRVDITDGSGDTVVTLTEDDFTGTNDGGTWTYEATRELARDGSYEATLSEATDGRGLDGADGQSGSITVNTLAATVVDGAADPNPISPGTTVSSQAVTVTLADVSADGDSDRHLLEFPDALADGLSVNSATVNGSAGISQSAELVDGDDGDGTEDTVRLQTDADDGGTVPLNVTVDVSVDYPDEEATYEVGARTEDSDGDTDERAAATTIDVAETSAPTITDYAASGAPDREVGVSFNASERLETITVDVSDSSGTTAATLDGSDFTETETDGTVVYAATTTVDGDGEYTATLEAAADADGNDGANDQSATVTVDSTPVTIVGGTATPDTVTPGEGVGSQTVRVELSNVSADGDSDRHYVEFPDALAEGLSVNAADVDGAADISQEAELVEGYDDDLTDDTVRFATNADGGGVVDLTVSVDVTVAAYPDEETTYSVGSRTVDSQTGTVTDGGVATIAAVGPSTADDGGIDGDSGADSSEDSDDGSGTGDASGALDGGDGDDAAPTVESFELTADGHDVDAVVRTDSELEELDVDVDGAVGVDLSEDAFDSRRDGGDYVYTADVSVLTAGSFEATLSTAANENGDAAAGQTDSLTVELSEDVGVREAATPADAGADGSAHAFSIPVDGGADIAGETLDGVVIGYSDAFRAADGSVSSVSNDQNVAALQVVTADGTVKSALGDTDAVSVDVADRGVRLDLSDVDGSRRPELESGDQVVIQVRPVTNPTEAGTHRVDVTLESATGNGQRVGMDVEVGDESTARTKAKLSEAGEEVRFAFDGAESVETVAVASETNASGIVRVNASADAPEGSAGPPGEPVATMEIDRPRFIEDSEAAISVALSPDDPGVDAGELVPSRYDEDAGEWVRLDTEVTRASDGDLVVDTTSSRTSTVAVSAVEDDARTGDTDTAGPDREVAGLNASAVDPGDMLGLGAVIALVALLVVVLVARRPSG